MAQELGTGYIIISPSTKGLGKAIEGSISDGTASGTQKSGKSIISTIGGAFGKIGKVGVGTIAGSYVLDGKITRGSKARITRDGEQIFEGPLASLKRFKDDVKEVNAGYECGLVFEGFNDLQEDDMIEVYIMVEVPR